MKAYITQFLNEMNFEKNDSEHILNAYDVIKNNKNANNILQNAISEYNKKMDIDWAPVLSGAEEMSRATGVHLYTVYLIIIICLSKKLVDYYVENGISHEIWHDTMLDFRYKTKECKLIKGVIGIFVPNWYGKFFTLNLFTLGRLQFRINTLRYDYNKNGVDLKIGDPVVDIHIPRTETPLTHEECIDSYNRAKDFFASKFIDKPMPFVCSSWLLFEENRKLLKENSNILKFMNDFDIIQNKYCELGDYSELWRLYDMDYTGSLDDFPEDTSFRRAYKNYLKSGGRFGSAYGIFIK